MNGYEALLFLHVVCVVVWLGAGTTLALIGLYGERSGDGVVFERLAALGRWLGPRVFAPAALGALVFGIALVEDGRWTFAPLWVRLGFAAFALSLLVTLAVRIPLLRRLRAGRIDARRGGRTLAVLGRFDLAVLYLAVADMVSKPTGSDTAALAVMGAVLAVAAAGVARAATRAS